MASIFERVRAIVVEQLGVDEADVVPTASFVDDLEADSLDLVELIMSLEEEFSGDVQLEISDEDAEKIVVEGYVNGEIFEAEHILMKCPSKYSAASALDEALPASGTDKPAQYSK